MKQIDNIICQYFDSKIAEIPVKEFPGQFTGIKKSRRTQRSWPQSLVWIGGVFAIMFCGLIFIPQNRKLDDIIVKKLEKVDVKEVVYSSLGQLKKIIF